MATYGEYNGGGSATTKLLLHLNGNSTDTSGNAKNGTDNAVTYSLANGKFGQGAGFNGSSTYIRCSIAMTATDNFTILFWVYLASNSLMGKFLENGGNTSGNNTGYAIGVGSTDMTKNGNNLILTTNNVAWIPTGKAIGTGWHLVGMQRISTAWYGIVDGIAYTASSTSNPSTPTGYTVLGCTLSSGTYSTYSTCNMDEVIMETRVWTATQLKKYYTMNKGRFGIV